MSSKRNPPYRRGMKKFDWTSTTMYSSDTISINDRFIGPSTLSSKHDGRNEFSAGDVKNDDSTTTLPLSMANSKSSSTAPPPNALKKTKKQMNFPLVGTETFRLNRELAQVFRMLVRFFYPGPDVWVVMDYLIMFPNIRDFDLADKCGLDVKAVRKAVAHLMRDHLVTSKIRAIKVPISEEEAKSRKKPVPSSGMKQQRHTFYQLVPHSATNAARYKLLCMRRQLDDSSIDPDEVGLPDGIELWFKCPYCSHKLTNLHADIVLAAGAFENDKATMPCPKCSTAMLRNSEGNATVLGSRKIMSVFNRKLKKVLDMFFKTPAIEYPAGAANQKFLEGSDLDQCTLFQKDDSSGKLNLDGDPKNRRERGYSVILTHDYIPDIFRNHKRTLPVWFMSSDERKKYIERTQNDERRDSEDELSMFAFIVAQNTSTLDESSDRTLSFNESANSESLDVSSNPKSSSFKESIHEPEIVTADGLTIKICDVDAKIYAELDPDAKNDYEIKAAHYRKVCGCGLITGSSKKESPRLLLKRSADPKFDMQSKVPRSNSKPFARRPEFT